MSEAAPEYWFYKLERTSVGAALAALLEKTLQRGWRALVRSSEAARVDELDDILWTYRDASFLPHGRADGPRAARQPVLLTTDEANVNQADVLFLLDGAEPPAELGGVARCVFMFDAADQGAVALARQRWKSYKDAGGQVSAWKEAEGGRWEKQA